MKDVQLVVTEVRPPTGNFDDVPCFAPKVEQVNVTYHIPSDVGEIQEVWLRVCDRDGRLVYETPPGERPKGAEMPLRWDGAIVLPAPAELPPPPSDLPPVPVEAGPPPILPQVLPPLPRAPYVDPLHAPYRIEAWARVVERGEKESSDGMSRSNEVGDVQKKCPAAEAADAANKEAADPASKEDRPKARDLVAVRYHSIELRLKPWAEVLHDACLVDPNGTPREPDEFAAWVKYRLNDIGCYAGPVDLQVDNTEGSDFGKAIWRYRHMRALPIDPANPRSDRYRLTELPLGAGNRYGDVKACAPAFATPTRAHWEQLYDSLAREPRNQPLGDESQNPQQFSQPGSPLKLFVDCNRFYRTNDEGTGDNEQYEVKMPPPAENVLVPADRTKKHEADTAWLSRPWLPVEVKIYLEDSKGGRQDVPEAVGEPRIKWSWNDQPENLDALAVRRGPPDYAREYLISARLNVEASWSSARHHNARQALGGLLEGDTPDPGDDARCVFRPYGRFALQPSADGVYTGACGDLLDWHLGKSCVYFGPSTIAGDNFQCEALLDLGPEDPRIGELHRRAHPASRNTPSPAKLSAASARVEVWRRIRIAALVHWPRRKGGSVVAAIGEAREQFARAYVDLVAPAHEFDMSALAGIKGDFEAIAREDMTRAGVSSQWQALDALRTEGRGNALQFSPEQFFNTKFDETEEAFQRLRLAVGEFFTGLTERFGQLLLRRVLEAMPEPKRMDGVILVDKLTYPYTNPKGFGTSVAAPGGVVFVSQNCFGFPLPKLLAHEVAHCVFMKHWLNAGGMALFDHDHSNRNCTMSYPLFELKGVPDLLTLPNLAQLRAASVKGLKEGLQAATDEKGEYNFYENHLLPGHFEPDFCGKCNLKLRGWNLRAKDPNVSDSAGMQRRLAKNWVLPVSALSGGELRVPLYRRFDPLPRSVAEQLQGILDKAIETVSKPNQSEFSVFSNALTIAQKCATEEKQRGAAGRPTALTEFIGLLAPKANLAQRRTMDSVVEQLEQHAMKGTAPDDKEQLRPLILTTNRDGVAPKPPSKNAYMVGLTGKIQTDGLVSSAHAYLLAYKA